MHNSESVLENESHNILWDFDIQMNHLILAWQPDIVIVNKKLRIFCRSDRPQSKIERWQKER